MILNLQQQNVLAHIASRVPIEDPSALCLVHPAAYKQARELARMGYLVVRDNGETLYARPTIVGYMKANSTPRADHTEPI